MKKLKLFFYNLISKILIIFLNILKFFGINLRINELETRAIGHFTKNIEIYLLSKNEKKFDNNKKYFDIWFRNSKIANSFLYNQWKRYIKIGPPFLSIFFNMIVKQKKFEFLIPCQHWRTHKGFKMDIDYILDRHAPLINFNKDEITNGDKALNSINFDIKKKFFCFANRDQQFRNDNDSFDQKIRNFKVSSFDLALKNLTNENMKAVRMGVENEEKLIYSNKYIFDYSFSKIKSNFLDFYIISKCDFFVSGNSGINDIPVMFRKPILSINMLPYSVKNNDNQFHKLIIFKKLYSNKKKRYLSYKEVREITLDEDILKLDKIKEQDILVIDNTKEEIFDLINEYTLKQKNEWIYDEDENKYQKKVNQFYRNIYKFDIKNTKIGYNFLKSNIDLFEV